MRNKIWIANTVSLVSASIQQRWLFLISYHWFLVPSFAVCVLVLLFVCLMIFFHFVANSACFGMLNQCILPAEVSCYWRLPLSGEFQSEQLQIITSFSAYQINLLHSLGPTKYLSKYGRHCKFMFIFQARFSLLLLDKFNWVLLWLLLFF